MAVFKIRFPDASNVMNADALLFVYGSLRRGAGHSMSSWLAEQAVWEGEASVEGALYRVSWYPALVPVSGAELWVRGDLYRLPSCLLPELDAYEDIRQQPEDEYRREQGLVQTGDGRQMAWIYWYVKAVDGMEFVQGGDWLQYQEGLSPE